MQLLRDHDLEPVIIEYLKNPPDEGMLRSLSEMLKLKPSQFIRKGEADFKAQSLKEQLNNDDILIKAMAAYPKLLERPIAVAGKRAILGRPPEKVLDLLS